MPKVQLFIIIGAITIIALLNSMFIVDQRQKALVLQFGDPVTVKDTPGLKFKIPFIQNVEYFDNRILNLDAVEKEVNAFERNTAITTGNTQNTDANTEEEGRLIRLIVDAYAKYRIVDPLKFYQSVRSERGLERRLDTVVESSLKQVLGGVSLTTLLSEERDDIMKRVRKIVNREGKSFGVDVVDVRIKRVELPTKNRDAVFTRMRSSKEKEATRLKAEGEEESKRIRAQAEKDRTVLLANAEKKGQILRGEGEAISTKVFADAYGRDPDFFGFYRSMQAYRKSLDKNNTRVVISPDNDFLRYMEKMN